MALRSYTLLGTTDGNSQPGRRDSTRPAGSIITISVDGRTARFKLTDDRLYDGTFVADPLDRFL
ncbi:hypothetical protein ACFXI8_27455 [Streptomyces niveus]|uniref:hypothetical protein n=1 Tax=Streptomyces niveus TaxID=193462 RepID=UPI00369D41BB